MNLHKLLPFFFHNATNTNRFYPCLCIFSPLLEEIKGLANPRCRPVWIRPCRLLATVTSMKSPVKAF
eukprot:Gb_11187 [translate_table: standard]